MARPTEGTLAAYSIAGQLVSFYVSLGRIKLSISFRRNMINILMYLAEHCKAHFSPADVPEMLDTMLPLLTKEVRVLSDILV